MFIHNRLGMVESVETLIAQQQRLNQVSNNLANADTAGYKKESVTFDEMLYNVTRNRQRVGKALNILTNHGQGVTVQTGNPLDLVIEGDGFFQVLMPDGTVAYSRAGAFKMDSDGRIVNSDGYPMEPAITIPANALTTTIGSDGKVTVLQAGSTTPAEIGQIEIAKFMNPGGLQALGKNLYLPTASSGDATTGTPGVDGLGTIEQGYVEMSNVNVVEEMVNMIVTQRAYEITSKTVQASDEMLQTTNNMKR